MQVIGEVSQRNRGGFRPEIADCPPHDIQLDIKATGGLSEDTHMLAEGVEI